MHEMSTQSPFGSLVHDAQAIFRAAIRRVQADQLIDEADPSEWTPQRWSTYEDVRVAGMGKAAMAMAGVLEDRYPEVVSSGLVVVPDGYPESYPERLPTPSTIEVVCGGHPLPSERSVEAGRRLLRLARETHEGELLLVVISGGGTALSTLPAESLSLPDLRSTYQTLLRAGVPIEPANAVRKHLTQVGGGQLARAAHPAPVGALVVSDVIGDDLSVIASGPTVPDRSTYDQAMRVLYQYGLWHEVPPSVREHLAEGARGRRSETPDAKDPCFAGTRTTLLGSNDLAMAAARREAEERGYHVAAVTSDVDGEAHRVGRAHVRTMTDAQTQHPTCWLWGGETTVTVTGDGKGGRNQEVALGAALALENQDQQAVVLSGGTDGIDGPTDAAGAWATPATAEASRSVGCVPENHLENNDAYALFDRIDQLLRPGPTHTNVMDVHVGLVRV